MFAAKRRAKVFYEITTQNLHISKKSCTFAAAKV